MLRSTRFFKMRYVINDCVNNSMTTMKQFLYILIYFYLKISTLFAQFKCNKKDPFRIYWIMIDLNQKLIPECYFIILLEELERNRLSLFVVSVLNEDHRFPSRSSKENVSYQLKQREATSP